MEVGYYSVALKLIESFGFIPMMLKNSLIPAILNAKKHSEEKYQNRLLNFYRLNFLVFLMTAIPIYIFSEEIVIVLFGIEYQPAGVLLSLMASRLFFANMGSARGCYIMAENLLKFSMLTMILGTLVNVGLNYLWIDEYGARGAIVATIVSFSTTIYFVDIWYRKTRRNILLQFRSIFTFYKLKL